MITRRSAKHFHFFVYLTALIPQTSFNHRYHPSVVAAAFSTLPSDHAAMRRSTNVGSSVQSDDSNSKKSDINNKIFCFGDSLTAGTAPPSFQEFPYAIHLESKLNSITSSEQEQEQKKKKYLVRHFGRPGWTATQLSSLEGNLQSILERIKTSTNTFPKLVIILAGTNDLAYCTNNNECDNIFNSIKSIHDICHERNIDTMALRYVIEMKLLKTISVLQTETTSLTPSIIVLSTSIVNSIPTSAWQSQSGNNASSFAKLINGKIESWAAERNQPKVHYVPFPIAEYDPNSGFWSPDGLHFSKEGYVSFFLKS